MDGVSPTEATTAPYSGGTSPVDAESPPLPPVADTMSKPGPSSAEAEAIDTMNESGGRGLKRRRLLGEDQVYRIIIRRYPAVIGGYWVQVPGDMSDLKALAERKLDCEAFRFRDANCLAIVDDVALFRDEMVLVVTTVEDETRRFGYRAPPHPSARK